MKTNLDNTPSNLASRKTLGSPLRRDGPLNILKGHQTEASVASGPEFRLAASKPDRNPTLPEKIEIVNKWFKHCIKGKPQSFKHAEVKIGVISELLVSKQLVSDLDTGVKHIMKSLNIKEKDKDMSLNYAHF